MIGLDTNVLVRYIVRDDARQAALSDKLIEAKCTKEQPGCISLVVLCELVWVLSRGYGYAREVIVEVLSRIIAADDLLVENSERARVALNLYRRGTADFADYLIGLGNRDQSAETTYTFDRRAADSDLFNMVS